jgi:hypothetical protein
MIAEGGIMLDDLGSKALRNIFRWFPDALPLRAYSPSLQGSGKDAT